MNTVFHQVLNDTSLLHEKLTREVFVSECERKFDDSDYVLLLNNNTTSNVEGNENWNRIYVIAFRILSLELEPTNIKKKPKIPDFAISFIQCILRLAVDLLQTKTLLKHVTRVFCLPKYREVKLIYISLLYQQILKNKNHAQNITFLEWQLLLEKCIDSFKEELVDNYKLQHIYALRNIIKVGCQNTILVKNLIQQLTFLVKLLERFREQNETFRRATFHLILIVCQSLSLEYRLELCKFGEIILPNLINVHYISTEDGDIYDLFLILIRAHHPRAVHLYQDAVRIFDENKWNRILNEMRAFLLKQCKSQDYESLIKLCCEVFTVTSKGFETLDTPNFVPTTLNNLQMFANMAVDTASDHFGSCTLIAILTSILKKYPSCLRKQDFVPILRIVSKLLQSPFDAKRFPHFVRLVIVLMDLEPHIFSPNLSEETYVYWNQIWNEWPKIVSAINTFPDHLKVDYYTLLHRCIVHANINDPSKFLTHYQAETITWSSSAISALLLFCQYYPLSLMKDLALFSIPEIDLLSINWELLNWCLFVPWDKLDNNFPVENLSKLAICLAGKSFQKKSCKNLSVSEEMQSYGDHLTLDDIEKCYISLITPIANQKNCEMKKISIQQTLPIDKEGQKGLDDLIVKILKLVVNTDDVKTQILKTVLIIRFTSDLINFEVISEDQHVLLNKKIQDLLEIISKEVYKLDSKENIEKLSTEDIVFFINRLHLLFKAASSKKVAKILIDYLSKDFFSTIRNLIQVKTKPKDQLQLKIAVLHLELAFGCLETEIGITDVQVNIVKDNLNVINYDLANDFLKIKETCNVILESNEQLLGSEIINSMTNLCMELYQHSFLNVTVIDWLLDKLLILYNHAKNIDANTENIFQLLFNFHEAMESGYYGLDLHFKFTKLLCNFVELDPTSIFMQSEKNTSFKDIILRLLKSPFYSIRFVASQVLHHVFGSKKINSAEKQNFFHDIKSVFISLTNIPAGLSFIERIPRIVSAVHIITKPIAFNSYYRNEVVNILLILQDKEKVCEQTTIKILSDSSREKSSQLLLENHLMFFLTSWSSQPNKNVNNFPFAFLSCANQEDYYKNYLKDIFCVIVMTSTLQESVTFCESINIRFPQALLSFFINILPWLIMEKDTNDTARELYTNTLEAGDTLKKSLKDNLTSILLIVIEKLHDADDFYKVFKMEMTACMEDNFNLNLDQWKYCMNEILKHVLKRDKNIYDYLFSACHEDLVKILTYLPSRLDSPAHQYVEEKLKCLHQCVSFYTWITANISNIQFNEMSTFIIQTICLDLLSFLRHEYISVAECAFTYFDTFLRYIISKKYKIINQIYTNLIKGLVNWFKRNQKNHDVLKTLIYLVKEEEETFQDEISRLVSFPEDDEFRELQLIRDRRRGVSTLEKEMKLFIVDTNDVFCRNNIEAIKHFEREIRKKKAELCNVQDQIIQDKTNSLVAFSLVEIVIARIIHILKSTNSAQLQLACAECLNAIGPIKFATTSIYSADITNFSKGFLTLTYNTILYLTENLSSSNFVLRKSIIECLYTVCGSVWANKIFQEGVLKELEEKRIPPQPKLPVKFLYSFMNSNKTLADSNNANFNTAMNVVKLEQIFQPDNDIWIMDTSDNYKSWIVDLTTEVGKCVNHFQDMSPVFRNDPHFCEKFLPELIHSILTVMNNLLSTFSLALNKFFVHHFNGNHDPKCHARSVSVMLDCVDYIKLHVPPTKRLELDLIAISRAAMFISSNIRGLYYIELACNEFLIEKSQNGQWYRLRELDVLDTDLGTKLQLLVRDHCVEIGDVDLINGCRLMFDDEPESLKKYYRNLNQWEKLISFEDIFEDDNSSLKDKVNDFQQNGFDWVAQAVASWTSNTRENWQYELAFQLADWSKLDEFPSRQSKFAQESFESVHLNALYNFAFGFMAEMKNFLQEAKSIIINDLHNQCIDNSRVIGPKLSRLQMLHEMEEFAVARAAGNYEDIFSNWKHLHTAKGCNFEDLKNILLQRRLMCKLSDGSEIPNFQDEIFNIHMTLSNIARAQGFSHKAFQELDIASISSNLKKEQSFLMKFEQALVIEARDEVQIAALAFRNLSLEENIEPNLKAKALIAYGDKMTEFRTQNPLEISTIYNEAYEILKNQVSFDCLMKVQIIMAEYTDARYQYLMDYTSSAEYISFRKSVEKSKPESKARSSRDNDVRKTLIILNKQYEEDCKYLEAIENNQNNFMISALKQYLDVLEKTDAFDTYLARVLTIWLKHKNNTTVNNLMKKRLSLIPSYKFVPLMRHIAPTLRNDDSLFNENIKNIIKRTTLDHPYHCVPVLLLLQNYQLDAEYFAEDEESFITVTKPKINAAKEMIKLLMDTNIREIINESNIVARALINIAYFPIDRNMQLNEIPPNHDILKVKDYMFTTVPTSTIQVKKNADYSNSIIGIHRYLTRIKLVSGVNQPKVITCVGTDGKKREELVKGRDDMRQDAIMQCLFKEVNSILNDDEEARKRNLRMRTYKILPLTQRSGVVEWCQNSNPIISILIGADYESGLHKKYFPNDETSLKCKARMKRVAKSTNEERLRVFNECCKLIHPAFHYYFLEKFPSPETWFENRSIFTKSVATSSIVGYIVGLGDRHLNNILLDTKTCEVIHIDFGIAFEHGSVIATPETVPFRLTRDIEAAMGPCAVDGLFRRCCEITLKALRNKHDILIMLLKFLLCDPLFQWLITEDNTFEEPTSSKLSSWKTIHEYNASNQPAQRAILRVQQRLQGFDKGTILSIPVQVNDLIQEARSPKNLCLLYDGWQPFL